jgi:hypothetical protein
MGTLARRPPDGDDLRRIALGLPDALEDVTPEELAALT